MWRWCSSYHRNYFALSRSAATARSTLSSSAKTLGSCATRSASENVTPLDGDVSVAGLRFTHVDGYNFIFNSYRGFASYQNQNKSPTSKVTDEADDGDEEDDLEDEEYSEDGEYEEDEEEEEVEIQTPSQNLGKKKIDKKKPESKTTEQQGRVLNESITAPTVRLVFDGEGHKVVSREEALRIAKKRNLDLVQVDGRAKPPVCKIFDFHKEEYRQEQIQKDRKKKKGDMVRLNEVKELRFTSKTELKDLKMKVDKAKKFMERGHRVKFVAIFKGSQDDEKKQQEQQKMIDDILEMVEDIATVEQGPRVEARQAWVMLRHVKFGTVKKKATAASPKPPKEAVQKPDVAQGQPQSKVSIPDYDTSTAERSQETSGFVRRTHEQSVGQEPLSWKSPSGPSSLRSDAKSQSMGNRSSVSQGLGTRPPLEATQESESPEFTFGRKSSPPRSQPKDSSPPASNRVSQQQRQSAPDPFSYLSKPTQQMPTPKSPKEQTPDPFSYFSKPTQQMPTPQSPLGRGQGSPPFPSSTVPPPQGRGQGLPPHGPLGRGQAVPPLPGRGQGAPWPGYPTPSQGPPQEPSQAPPVVSPRDPPPPQGPAGRGQGAPWLSPQGYPRNPPPPPGMTPQPPPPQYSHIGPQNNADPFQSSYSPQPQPPMGRGRGQTPLQSPPQAPAGIGRGQGAPWLSSRFPPPPPAQSQGPPVQGAPWSSSPGNPGYPPPPAQGYPGYPPPPAQGYPGYPPHPPPTTPPQGYLRYPPPPPEGYPRYPPPPGQSPLGYPPPPPGQPPRPGQPPLGYSPPAPGNNRYPPGLRQQPSTDPHKQGDEPNHGLTDPFRQK